MKKKRVRTNLLWKVESLADGSIMVYPPWKRKPGFEERINLALDIRRTLQASAVMRAYPGLRRK